MNTLSTLSAGTLCHYIASANHKLLEDTFYIISEFSESDSSFTCNEPHLHCLHPASILSVPFSTFQIEAFHTHFCVCVYSVLLSLDIVTLQFFFLKLCH